MFNAHDVAHDNFDSEVVKMYDCKKPRSAFHRGQRSASILPAQFGVNYSGNESSEKTPFFLLVASRSVRKLEYPIL